MEEPFVTAQANDAVSWPDYWPEKCAEMCGALGLELPENIKSQVKKWTVERYETLLQEHCQRMNKAKDAQALPISTEEEAPPSIVRMAAQTNAEADVTVKHKEADETKVQNEIDKELEDHLIVGTGVGAEPSYEDDYADDDF